MRSGPVAVFALNFRPSLTLVAVRLLMEGLHNRVST